MQPYAENVERLAKPVETETRFLRGFKAMNIHTKLQAEQIRPKFNAMQEKILMNFQIL